MKSLVKVVKISEEFLMIPTCISTNLSDRLGMRCDDILGQGSGISVKEFLMIPICISTKLSDRLGFDS